MRNVPSACAIAIGCWLAFHSAASAGPHRIAAHPIGLGAVLTSAFKGQIFGFDVERNGSEGILTEAPGFGSALETFDVTSGAITHVVDKLQSPSHNDELVTFGIFAADVGLVDDQRVQFKNGRLTRDDLFFLLNPVTGERITGKWTPPHPAGLLLTRVAENQLTAAQASLVYRLPADPRQTESTQLLATNFARNATTSFVLDQNLFGFANSPQLAEDGATDQAVFALSPDAGRVGGAAPVNVLVDLATGKQTQFTGSNNGPFGAGFVNGLAVDSSTGIACTTTELNAQVEFYTLATGTGVAVQMPNTGPTSQLNSGTTVAVDSVNHLFLVAQPFSSTSKNSSLDIFDETGHLLETINGLSLSITPGMVVQPSLRLGWINGPGADQLQQFFY